MGGMTLQRVDYGGPTVGVEQEIASSQKVYIANPANRGRLGHVERQGQVLVEFTSDIGSDETHLYTIELKTTPVEQAAAEGIADRKTATGLLVRAVLEAGRERRSVAPMVDGEFRLVIAQPGHEIRFDEFGSQAVGFANQASTGMQTRALLGQAPEALLVLENAQWYQRELGAQLPPGGLDDADAASTVYGLVASVVQFLASRVQAFPHLLRIEGGMQKTITGDLYNSEVKDSWGVLPRTPVWDWLNVLSQGDQTAVQQRLIAASNEDSYRAALAHIRNKLDLAGHPIPESTIGGEQASVFEFRSPPAELNQFFYVPPEEQQAREEAPRGLNPALVKGGLRRPPGMDDDSSDSDSGDW